METKLTVQQIQRLIVEHEGGPRKNTFVPNVSWGFFRTHEADLVMLSKAGYLTEYEIKRSWSDFLADFKKTTNHFEGKVMQLYYVVPECIADKCWEFIKNHEWKDPYNPRMCLDYPPVGLIWYSEEGRVHTKQYAPLLARFTESDNNDYKLFLEEQLAIMRLGVMRLWTRKEPQQPQAQNETLFER